MKTLEQIKKYRSQAIDMRDLVRLMEFFPKEDLMDWGRDMGREFHFQDNHAHTELTREAVLAQLEKDVAFGFEKALDQRGISADCMFQVVAMWNWVLEEGLEGFRDYAHYGLPLFKATAVKYGFPNPIGDDTGSEAKYSADGEGSTDYTPSFVVEIPQT
jgi:hypothetical protein